MKGTSQTNHSQCRQHVLNHVGQAICVALYSNICPSYPMATVPAGVKIIVLPNAHVMNSTVHDKIPIIKPEQKNHLQFDPITLMANLLDCDSFCYKIPFYFYVIAVE